MCVERILWELCEGWIIRQESIRLVGRENGAGNAQTHAFVPYQCHSSKSVASTTEKPHKCEILASEPRRKGILAPKSGGD